MRFLGIIAWFFFTREMCVIERVNICELIVRDSENVFVYGCW